MSEATALVIGVDDIPQKEQLVLRSLLRLLDGRLGSRLSFSDSLRDCNVVFAGQDPAAARFPSLPSAGPLVVRVLPEDGAPNGAEADGLSIRAPLRMTNVMETLRACVDVVSIGRLNSAASFASTSRSGIGLLELLVQRPLSSTRPSEAYSLAGHGRMLVDFRNDRVHAGVPAGELIGGGFRITPARWDSALEEEARRSLPGFRLRDLLWSSVHRLGQEDAAASAPNDVLPGRFRLLRWPDAAALRQPGYPRLAAVLTNGSLDIAGACEASGVPPAGVRWFLELSLALGIAEAIDGRESAAAAIGAARPAPKPAPVAAQGPVRSVIGRLRERLKLW